MAHVTLDGDLTGDYAVTEQREDGTLVLTPQTAYHASLKRRGLRAATPDELDAWVAEHGPLLPADDEG